MWMSHTGPREVAVAFNDSMLDGTMGLGGRKIDDGSEGQATRSWFQPRLLDFCLGLQNQPMPTSELASIHMTVQVMM